MGRLRRERKDARGRAAAAVAEARVLVTELATVDVEEATLRQGAAAEQRDEVQRLSAAAARAEAEAAAAREAQARVAAARDAEASEAARSLSKVRSEHAATVAALRINPPPTLILTLRLTRTLTLTLTRWRRCAARRATRSRRSSCGTPPSYEPYP